MRSNYVYLMKELPEGWRHNHSSDQSMHQFPWFGSCQEDVFYGVWSFLHVVSNLTESKLLNTFIKCQQKIKSIVSVFVFLVSYNHNLIRYDSNIKHHDHTCPGLLHLTHISELLKAHEGRKQFPITLHCN